MADLQQSSKPTAAGFDGAQAAAAVPNKHTATGVTVDNPIQLVAFILRFLAIITSFIATIVMGVAKQTILTADVYGFLVDLTIKTTGPGASQLEYFIAVNVIAFVYACASLAVSILHRRSSSSPNIKLMLSIADLVMVVLLFSGNGSATAMSVLSRKGAGAIWSSICDVYGKYCASMAGAIAVSMLGAVAFFALVLLSIIEHHRRSP